MTLPSRGRLKKTLDFRHYILDDKALKSDETIQGFPLRGSSAEGGDEVERVHWDLISVCISTLWHLIRHFLRQCHLPIKGKAFEYSSKDEHQRRGEDNTEKIVQFDRKAAAETLEKCGCSDSVGVFGKVFRKCLFCSDNAEKYRFKKIGQTINYKGRFVSVAYARDNRP